MLQGYDTLLYFYCKIVSCFFSSVFFITLNCCIIIAALAANKVSYINLYNPTFDRKTVWYQPGSELRRRLRRISINRSTRMHRTLKTMFLPRSIAMTLLDIPAPPYLRLYYTRRLSPRLSRQEWTYLTSAHPGCHRQRRYLPIQWSHRGRDLPRGLLPPLRCKKTVSGDKIGRLSAWLAVSYGGALWLPCQHGPRSRQCCSRFLATSATNCVDFADKVTTIMVGCSNVLDNSDNGHKVTNISNS